MELPSFTKSAKDLSRNPLGIIALFIVLVYGFACLLFGFSASDLESAERSPIIWFVVLFPVLVLGLFGWLVSNHHDKLYAPTDYRDDDSFLRTVGQKAVVADESSRYVEDLLQYGGDFDMISEQEELIKNDMIKRGLACEGQTTQVLVRQLAACQVINWFDRTYHDIFGSQIAFLKLGATESGIDKAAALNIFTQAKNKFSDILGGWDLEQYLKYLLDSKLIEKTQKGFITTKRGSEFIKILSSSGYSVEKNL